MAFDDVQFPTGISWGAVGGPGYNTEVIQVESGHENRNQNWPVALMKWDCSHAIKTRTDIETLLAFFRARKGKARSFRFKDWTDYSVTDQALRPGGAPTVQLEKTYVSGGVTEYRTIAKPIASISMKYAGGAYVPSSVDYGTGIVTLSALSSKAITGITQASPGVVTAVAHGFSSGDEIYISGVSGMTQVNSTVFTITVIDPNTFSIGVNTSAYTAYIAGGTAAKYPQTDGPLVWTGEFDVPARFDTDEMKISVDNPNVFSWGTVPIVEVRDIA